MRLFHLLNLQHVVLYFFPTVIAIFLLGTALGFTHFTTKNSEKRKKEIHYRYPDNTSDQNAPFPLFMILVIAGALVWGVGYILAIGILEVKI